MNNGNYNVYRCLDTRKYKVDTPWFRQYDVCPCNPEISNPTGRGLLPCPFGYPSQNMISKSPSRPKSSEKPQGSQWDKAPQPYLFEKTQHLAEKSPALQKIADLSGSLYQENTFTPPQLEPRPIARIGQQWRSGN